MSNLIGLVVIGLIIYGIVVIAKKNGNKKNNIQ
jgi:hypothetical protein